VVNIALLYILGRISQRGDLIAWLLRSTFGSYLDPGGDSDTNHTLD